MLDQVDAAVGVGGGLQRVEPLLDDRVDQRGEPVQAPHGELGGEQAAQPGVVRRVGETEATRFVVLGDAVGTDQVGEIVAEGAGVAQDFLGLVVAGDQPDRDGGDGEPADGLAVAQGADLGDGVEAVAAERQQGRFGELGKGVQIERGALAAEAAEITAGEPAGYGGTGGTYGAYGCGYGHDRCSHL